MAFTGRRQAALDEIDEDKEANFGGAPRSPDGEEIRDDYTGTRRRAGRQALEDRVRGPRIHHGRAAEISDYDVSDPASGRLTIYRSRPAAAVIPAADIHAAGTVHAADSRRLDTSVSAAAAADDTP